MNQIQTYIKKCRELGFKDDVIRKALLNHNVSEKSVDDSFKKLELNNKLKISGIALIGILLMGIILFNPTLTGFVVKESSSKYSDNVGFVISESSSHIWMPTNNGELTSLLASGRIIGNGSAKMYLVVNNTRYLIVDTSTLEKTTTSLLTGLVIDDALPLSDIENIPIEVVSEETSLKEEITVPTITEETPIDAQIESIIIVEEKTDAQTPALDSEINNNVVINEVINDTVNLEIIEVVQNDSILSQETTITGTASEVSQEITQSVEKIIGENISTTEVNNSIIDINNSNDLSGENISVNNILNENISLNERVSNDTLIDDTLASELNQTDDESVINETENILNENISTEIINNNETINELNFNSECVDTCVLSGLIGDSYTIEFEIDGDAKLIIDTFYYTISEGKIFDENISINETQFNETLLNITLNNTVLENLSLNISSNLTLNISLNETLLNLTLNDTLVNESLLNVTELNAIINGTVEIEKPVLWKLKVNSSRTKEIVLPKESFNISTNGISKIRFKDTNFTVDQFNSVKENNILKKDLKKLNDRKIKNTQKNIKAGKNKKAIDTTVIDKQINDLSKKISSNKVAQNITIDSNITLVINNSNDVLVDNASNMSNTNLSEIIEFEYYTEGPTVFENVTNDYEKQVTISSDLHYQNIKAYTDIVESRKEMITLNWLTSSGKVRVDNINYVDTNSNGLIDRIEWTVPHLSNQTYEVNISVLNLHSYPMVGAEWRVEFITTGKANLTITAENGTVYGRDISPLTLKCGNNILTPVITSTSVFYADYECNETGYFTALELRQGHHLQKFMFGDAMAYAYNFAGNLPQTINLHGKLTNSTGSAINATVNMTFKLYNDPSTGSADWTETQTNINVSEGIYTAILGAVTPISVNFSVPYWLGIAVNGDSEMTPRINMTNTPNSFNAFYAQQALEAFDLTCTDCIGNTEINTTGVFRIDGNLNATNNITLGDSVIGSDGTPRFQITSSGVVVNLQ